MGDVEERRLAGIPVHWLEVVPGRLACWVPARPDDLLDALDEATCDATDERLPYFATLWPAGEALARSLLDGDDLQGLRVLDLGCGVGAVALAAALRGARVVALDWEARSLELVAASARRLGAPVESTVAADWRAVEGLGHFDRILAADVLYEPRNVEPVVDFVRAHLAPGGEAWIADPRRQHAETLPEVAVAAGLVLRERSLLAYRPRGIRVERYRLALAGDER